MVMITEYIFMVIMGWCIGYLSHKGIRAYKKKRTIKRANKEFYNPGREAKLELGTYWLDVLDEATDFNIQGPPRGSVMATLEDLLEIAIKNENYEYAAKLRDRIKQQNEKTP